MANEKCPACLGGNTEGASRCEHCGTPLSTGEADAQPDTNFRPGDVVNDRYEILEHIDSGGMGAIYKVHDKMLDEVLALKVLLPYLLTDQAVVDRFMNEVRITRKIAHPNIVRVHDFGAMDDGMFISMEYVEGETLRARLDRLAPNERLTPRFILHIINQICIALKYAHHYTVHRDIKPENIMITTNKSIKLVDFGISKIKDARFAEQNDVVVGTLQYMAPEQMAGVSDLDGRADIYSVGVVLHELLVGRLPENGINQLDALRDKLPPPLLAVLQKCLAPDRARRFQNAGELRDALRPIVEGLELSSSPGIPAEQLSSFEGPRSSTTSETFMEAMQAFMEEDKPARAVVPSVPTGMAERLTPLALALTRKALLGLVVVAGALLLLAGAYYLQPVLEGCAGYEDDAPAYVHPNHALRILEAGGVMDAFEEAVKVLSVSDTPENRDVLETVRQELFAHIEARAYARPFDMGKLNEASNDIARAAQLDADPRVRQLADTITREVAQFKFVATHIDGVEKTATFRLNNPFISFETQTVSEGDLLQDRFLITHIGARYVNLEDISDLGGGRRLSARLMTPVDAE